MQSTERYYRRRAQEELSAAARAVTPAAAERRRQLADSFLARLHRFVEGDAGKQPPCVFETWAKEAAET